VEEIAEVGSLQMRMGLDNMFVGAVMTHEQRISILSLEDWDSALTRIEGLTAKYDKIYKGWDYVAEYAKNKTDSQISQVDFDESSMNVECTLKGNATMPLYLYVFKNKGPSVEYKFQQVPVYKEAAKINFNIGAFLNLSIQRANNPL